MIAGALLFLLCSNVFSSLFSLPPIAHYEWEENGTYYGLAWELFRTNLFRTQRHKDAEIKKTLRFRDLAFKTIQTRV